MQLAGAERSTCFGAGNEPPRALLARITAGAKRFAARGGDVSTAAMALKALEALAKWPPLRDALLTSGLLQVAAEAARVHPAEASVQVRCLRPARNL